MPTVYCLPDYDPPGQEGGWWGGEGGTDQASPIVLHKQTIKQTTQTNKQQILK